MSLASKLNRLPSFTIILDLVEVMLFVRNMLKPVSNIVMQCVKSTIWTVWFVLTIAGAAEGNANGLGIFLALVLLYVRVKFIVACIIY